MASGDVDDLEIIDDQVDAAMVRAGTTNGVTAEVSTPQDVDLRDGLGAILRFPLPLELD